MTCDKRGNSYKMQRPAVYFPFACGVQGLPPRRVEHVNAHRQTGSDGESGSGRGRGLCFHSPRGLIRSLNSRHGRNKMNRVAPPCPSHSPTPRRQPPPDRPRKESKTFHNYESGSCFAGASSGTALSLFYIMPRARGDFAEIKKKYAMQAERLFHYLAPLIPRIKIHVIVHSAGVMT